MNSASAYDVLASGFERQRTLPAGVPQLVRAAVMAGLGHGGRRRVLDLGAGSGRFGWPVIAAGDDYVGMDLSAGMLRNFAQRYVGRGCQRWCKPTVGAAISAACFDLVLLIAVFGDLPDWRPLVDEARRVLRPDGVIAIGRTALPDDGIDARLKERLEILLDERMSRQPRKTGRQRAAQHLVATASTMTERVAASWTAERSPRQFLDRHAGGARFSATSANTGRRTPCLGGLGTDAVRFARHDIRRSPSVRDAVVQFRRGIGQNAACRQFHADGARQAARGRVAQRPHAATRH
jgi:ubiquinone/menaquinone biosynthesis C-methylase UbiE